MIDELARRCEWREASEVMGGTTKQNIRQMRQHMLRGRLPATRKMSVHEVWALGIARAARLRGESFSSAADIYMWLRQMPAEEIERSFVEGRTILFIVNGRAMPRLTTREAIESEYLRRLRREAAEAGIDCRTLALDTRPMLTQLIEAAGRRRRGRR